MALTWSHAVLYVKDAERMLDFYTRVLGFRETDRGMIGGGEMEIIFLSQIPREHHQLAFIPIRNDEEPSNTLAHLAFRVGDLGELRTLISTLRAEDVALRPVSHGNTWSVYLSDPEGNGLELFCDSTWHVQQPAGKTWDLDLDDASLRAWTQQAFEGETGFTEAETYYAGREQALSES